MGKTIAALFAIAYLALCFASQSHADSVCADTRNESACQLALMAGQSDSVARDAGMEN